VRYELSGAPDHVSVCHCRMCQKASGGPIMAFARVRKGALRWTRGQPASFRSSSLVERQFCAACGTPLTYSLIEGPNISVTIGSLDDPEAARPVLQYSFEHTLSWFPTITTLPGKRTDGCIRKRLWRDDQMIDADGVDLVIRPRRRRAENAAGNLFRFVERMLLRDRFRKLRSINSFYRRTSGRSTWGCYCRSEDRGKKFCHRG